MINLNRFGLEKITLLFTLLTSLVVLPGCGGDVRDTEFIDPRSSSASSGSNHGKEITFRVLANLEKITPAVSGGSVSVDLSWDTISNEDEFKKIWSWYSDKTPPTLAFDKGQVVLVDSGERKTCEAQYRVETFKAYEDGTIIMTLSGRKKVSSSSTSSVKVVAAESSSSSSDCSGTELNHPYAFYYVETRDDLFVTIQ
jgi:hypothetical protein